MEDHFNKTTAAGEGGESEIKSLKDDKDESEESETTTEQSYSVNKPGEAQHPKQSNESTGGESENMSVLSTINKRGISPLRLVLFGDPSSIEIGSKNILLNNDKQTNLEQFSSHLYDLCGRHVYIINMLGLQNTEKTPLNQEIDAFLLLLPNGLHNSHYNSGLQWLEKGFGRGALSYLIIVLTHKTDESCESALKELEANPGFDKKRYYTCTKSMTKEKEIADLLEKIDLMVSKNDPQSYSRLMSGESIDQMEEGQQKDKLHGEEKRESEFKTKGSSIHPSILLSFFACLHSKKMQTSHRNAPARVTISVEDEDKDTYGIKSDPQTGHADQTQEKSGNTTRDVESETGPHLLPSTNQTGPAPSAGHVRQVESHEINVLTGASSSNMSIDEADRLKNTVPTSQTVSSDGSEGRDPDNITAKPEQSTVISEKIIRKKPCQPQVEELLKRLDLQDRLQEQLSPAEFLPIRQHVKEQCVMSEKDLAHTFLSRLIMLDYNARYIPITQDSTNVTHLKPNITEENDRCLEVFLKSSVDSPKANQTHVHPMDVQMAVFHCSDSFLKQMMITKLSQCQYALPLLVPDPITMDIECPLWTFRQITKTWKISQIKENSTIVTIKSIPICKAETPLVSFFRLGSLSVSKSQLMNTLINDRHPTFFHRNCKGSTRSPHLIDGVAEIAWYCPAGKPTDSFSDCIAFCNLHGDALSNDRQRDILIAESLVNVFLASDLQNNEKIRSIVSNLFNSSKALICLTVDDSSDVVEAKKGKYKMGLKDRSQSDVSEELKKIIRKLLPSPDSSSVKPTFQLETIAERSRIKVDESDPACKKGKSAAMSIVALLTKESKSFSKIKDKFLPCQGHLWHEWSKIHKKLYHLRGDIEKDKSEKENELMNIRQKQLAASCSKLMDLFTESLSSLPPTEKEYFLKWTQILIDAHSTDDLSSILQRYDKKWSEVLNLKNKQNKSKPLLELEDISKELQSATFGLEHIFREMGQIYEAYRTMQRESRHTNWSKYPELAAQLMISGYPMELMDGDAGHVPVTWISSLLDEVIEKLGDRKVFVLSVLGLQSSGKSTMLNTMFGLQFAVSAGRCTKGAFMQLLKVSEEMKKDIEFDYVIVVDTEGLRALELEGNISRHHDNELATFVVGLGNLTLINIYGENPSEMQDILQIVVQAFMRMKKVQLSPSCVFVHQNVTDVAAAEKNMDGKRRLQEKLDQMAQLAAKEEVYNAECFSDVIEFDVQKDVKYCAQLWEGSPPMAPPNPGYSESIQEVKNVILSKASKSAGITLSQFKTKIQDLWDALLNENFVFSFKNTLEIAVYRELEVQYGNWTWALRSNMLTIENQLHNRIENGKLDKVEINFLYKESNKTYEEIKNALKIYFEDDREKEILAQWRGRFEIKIEQFREQQVDRVKRKLDEVIHQKEARKKMDDKKTEFENNLLQKSKELAHQLKDKAKDEDKLQKQFNSVWSSWVNDLTKDTKSVEDIKLEEDQYVILQELGFEWGLIDECKKSQMYKKILVTGDYSNYVSHPKNVKLGNNNKKGSTLFTSAVKSVQNHIGFSLIQEQKSHKIFGYEEQQQIRSLIDKVEEDALRAIQKKPVATRGYTPTYLQEVAKNVKELVTQFPLQRQYPLKKEFTVDLLLYVFYRAKSWLIESQEKFKINNDPRTYLESKKTQYYTVFRSFCKGNSSAAVLGELICEKLKISTVEAVCNRTAIDLAGEMRCNFPAFNGNRLNLEKHVLKSLVEKEHFDDFINYIKNPRRQTEAFIKAEVEKYIFQDCKDKVVNILQNNVDKINKLVSHALLSAAQKVKTQRGGIEIWLKEFSSMLKDDLTFDTICSQNFSDITDFEFLREEIKKGLASINEKMSSLSQDKLKKSRLKPEDELIDQLCKCCWVTCPFCSAVCTNTIENHSPDDHSVPFHRPDGIHGWHYRNTQQFSINFCTTNVASDGSFYPHHDSEKSLPYKQYRTAGPKYANWRITPDESKLSYWKWFVCRFQKELEDHYNLLFQVRGEIPKDWTKVTKEEAIKSLDEINVSK